ncbi:MULTISPECIES: ATP-binding protein [Streptomyces]|uniref:ATP-binding protein n=1 Tax=Streptomyces celluloflavus TaxID=58344 RepID=A0ABW7RHZ7_9ACTN|nr:ATP-binding protein [Streptomyces kasugaensis]WSK12055.1 ATP-binding protein [Streptomyces celluloflavus]
MTRIAGVGGIGVQPEPLSVLSLHPVPESAALARRHFRRLADGYGLGWPVDDGVLLVSELVGNAVRHAAADGPWLIRLEWWRIGHGLRTDVHSPGSPERVRMRAPEPEATDGRGLLLLDHLATAWAVEPSPHGGTMVSFLIGEVRPQVNLPGPRPVS